MKGKTRGGFRHLRVALYARVSTIDQQTIPMQLEALRRYARDRNWQIVLEEKEVGSGMRTRPRREELLKAARRRDCDVVLVWKLDRWGRSLADLALTLSELNALGVAMVSLTEAFDLTTPSGRAMAGLLAVFAEFENETRRERVLAGIAEARRKGTRLGRPRTVNPFLIRKIGEGIAAHESISAIARRLDLARSTVRHYLNESGSQI